MGFYVDQDHVSDSSFVIRSPYDQNLTTKIHETCVNRDELRLFSLISELESRDKEKTDIYTKSLALRAWIANTPGNRIRDVDREVYTRLHQSLTFSGILYDLNGESIYYHSPFLTSLIRDFPDDDCYYFWELTPKESVKRSIDEILDDHAIGYRRGSNNYTSSEILEAINDLLNVDNNDQEISE